jgi:CheY-like chemotaxis protein
LPQISKLLDCRQGLARLCVRSFHYIGIEDVVDRVKTGATVKARLPTASRLIKPSDLRAQAEKLIADGMMPDLDTVLDAVGQIRTKYQPKILEARRQTDIHVVRKTL